MQQNATNCYSEKNAAATDAANHRPGGELRLTQGLAVASLLHAR
jgi:hypothetical protein